MHVNPYLKIMFLKVKGLDPSLKMIICQNYVFEIRPLRYAFVLRPTPSRATFLSRLFPKYTKYYIICVTSISFHVYNFTSRDTSLLIPNTSPIIP